MCRMRSHLSVYVLQSSGCAAAVTVDRRGAGVCVSHHRVDHDDCKRQTQRRQREKTAHPLALTGTDSTHPSFTSVLQYHPSIHESVAASHPATHAGHPSSQPAISTLPTSIGRAAKCCSLTARLGYVCVCVCVCVVHSLVCWPTRSSQSSLIRPASLLSGNPSIVGTERPVSQSPHEYAALAGCSGCYACTIQRGRTVGTVLGWCVSVCLSVCLSFCSLPAPVLTYSHTHVHVWTPTPINSQHKKAGHPRATNEEGGQHPTPYCIPLNVHKQSDVHPSTHSHSLTRHPSGHPFIHSLSHLSVCVSVCLCTHH